MNTIPDIYSQFIDELVQLSRSCDEADSILSADSSADYDDPGLSCALAKLSGDERKLIASCVSRAFRSGIYSTLDTIEWHSRSGSVKLLFNDEPTADIQPDGIQNDFMNKCNKWEWSE